MKSKQQTSSFFSSPWLFLAAPLFIFPWMLNLRIFPFIAPNEEPKWALLIFCALWLSVGLTVYWFQRASIFMKKPNIVGILFIGYLLLLAVGIFVGPNTTEGFIRFAFWLFVALIWLISAWAAQKEPKWIDALVWSTSVASFVFSLRYWWSYFQDFGKPNYNISVLFSPIGHVNFTGDVLVILLPLLVWILASYHNPILRVVNWFSVTTVATVLLVASSRGALGGLALASIVIALIALKHRHQLIYAIQQKKNHLPVLLAGSALLISIPIYDLLPYHYRDLARVSATAGQAMTGEGKKILTPHVQQPPLADMWAELSPLLGARTNIYACTTAMTWDAPLLGKGTGNFAWVYPNYSNRYPDFRDTLSSERTFTTNPHNIILQIASQNGVPAMLIFIGLLLLLWYRLLRNAWQAWNPWLTAGAAAITAACFDAMFNHVFFNPASMFTFALLAGTWWGHAALHARSDAAPIKLPAKLLAITTLGLIIALSIWPTRWIISEWFAGQAMMYSHYNHLESEYYSKAYSMDPQNFRAVFGMGQGAYKQKNYAESAHFFEEFESFYPYNPPALNMLGASYMMQGDFKKAEAAMQRALAIYPNFEMADQNLKRIQAILNQQRQSQLYQNNTHTLD